MAGDNGVNVGVLGWGDGSKVLVSLDLKAKHPMYLTHIVNVEMLSESIFHGLD